MSGGPLPGGGALRFTNAGEYHRWLQNCFHTAESWRTYIKAYGKPIVRVPLERQTPNEADL